MRGIAVAVLVLFLIFFVSFVSSNFLLSSAKDVNSSLDSLERIVRGNNWKDTSNSLTSVDNKWKQIKNKWAVLLDHQEIDNIEISLSRMNEFVRAKNLSQSLAEISALKLLIEHIPDKEALSLKNIF